MVKALDPILADLNEAQREAVTHDGGPLLVVAGAGTGKTRVITRRIAWRIQRGLHSSQILAITFTNKAAGEMRSRVEQLIGPSRMWISTFHALGARLLRTEADAAGLSRNFTILDAGDQAAVVKDVLKELRLTGKEHRPADYLAAISRMKEAGESAPADDDPTDAEHLKVYREYEKLLAESQLLDFDDLLLRPVRLLEGNEEVRRRFASRFATVLVDEYQDTNQLQYRLARVIARDHGDICVTGDPDQSIYRWRGADIRNILEFERDFTGARVVKLEENYRSTNVILRAASAVIRNNRSRIERDLRSSLGDGERIRVLCASTEEAEARRILEGVRAALNDGYRAGDVAIFYRTNASSRSLERELRFANIPYVIVGAVAFYERREIKDLLSYLRVIANPHDAVAMTRILNVPTRGIGLRTVQRLREEAQALGVPLRDLVLDAANLSGIRPASRSALERFAVLQLDLLAMPRRPVLPVLDEVIQRTQYLAYLREQGDPLEEERLENVEELRRAVHEFDLRHEEGGLEEFLNETVLLRSREEDQNSAVEKITMMTLHSAKGLEFPVVFISSLEEGVLPHARSMDSEEGIEEERRLMYVGITRAQRRLTLSYALSRSEMGGRFGPSIPSRFLAELPEELTERAGGRTSYLASVAVTGSVEPVDNFGTETAFEPDYDADEPPYAAGDRVVHPSFGMGRVVRLTGFGPSAKITVRFERHGEKRLILEYARLRKAYD